MLALIWQGFPFFAVMILAGLQTVPRELYEAAEIDGATAFRQFVHVTAPSIAGIVATAVLLRIIWVANSLDVILVMTGGGPGYATHTLPLYAFLRAYTGMEFGYAAALSLLLTLMLLSIVWLYVARQARELERMSRRLSPARRILLVEIPVLAILVFALAPFVWMLITSVKPTADLSLLPRALLAEPRHVRALRQCFCNARASRATS